MPMILTPCPYEPITVAQAHEVAAGVVVGGTVEAICGGCVIGGGGMVVVVWWWRYGGMRMYVRAHASSRDTRSIYLAHTKHRAHDPSQFVLAVWWHAYVCARACACDMGMPRYRM